MSTLQSLNLKYNPFRDLTPGMGGNLIWAGIDEIKMKIERIYNETIRNNTKQIILNWGPFGGGKTYSAFYFAQQESAKNLLHIYIKSPKDGGTATDEFFKSIVDNLTYEKIQQQIRSVISEIGEKQFLSYLTPIASAEFAKVFVLMASEDSETQALLNRFLYAGLTKAELKKIGLAKDIQSDMDSVRFLSGLLACFIGNDTFINGRVVLWIDEMEDMIYYSPKTYKTFSQVLRELIDSIRDRLIVFMNFTLSEGQENTIELVLGGAVWSRITKKIRFKEFSLEDAERYCDKLLQLAKIDRERQAPFDKSLVNELLTRIHASNLIPREINKYFNSLISYCLDHDVDLITQDSINKWMEEYSYDN